MFFIYFPPKFFIKVGINHTMDKTACLAMQYHSFILILIVLFVLQNVSLLIASLVFTEMLAFVLYVTPMSLQFV